VAPHHTADSFICAFDNAVFEQSLFRVFRTAWPIAAASRQNKSAALLVSRDSGNKYVND